MNAVLFSLRKLHGRWPDVDVVHKKVEGILESTEPVILPKGAEGELHRALQSGIERLGN